MANKRQLFEDDSDADEQDVGLKINDNYAERYEKWREAELKQQLEDRYGNVDEELSTSSSEDDDDDPEELKKVLSKDFFELMSSLKSKDPRLLNPDVKFFENEDPLEQNRLRKEKQKDKTKPVFLRDYERKLITERGGQLSDDESDQEKAAHEKRAHSPSYAEEQRQLREGLVKAVHDDSDEDGGLFKKKDKTQNEKDKEEEEYLAWLKGEKNSVKDTETVKTLKPLKDMWNDPKLDDAEKYLRDYVLNQRYLEKDNDQLDAGDVSEDELQDKYISEFEHKYNFRFEEPDTEFLKRYPRTMEHSMRKKDTRRKEHRDAVKARKEEEKLKRKEELKMLKALKRKEIQSKIEKIKQITGNEDLGLNPEELEDEFDPEAHDRRMKELFNEDYYEGAEDAEDEEELNLPPLEEELIDDHVNWDDWTGTENEQGEGAAEDENYVPHCEDQDFNMDCDYDPATDTLKREEKAAGRRSAREKRKLKRQSRFGRLVRKEKPTFDPNDKTFQEYVDEYYGMDYEDLIGDMPCRFKYRSVIPNSFGLTIEEILAADDKELNQWASIKKIEALRPEYVEKYDIKAYDRKAQDEALKRKILPSLYKNETQSVSNEKGEKKKKKKRKHAVSDGDEEPKEDNRLTGTTPSDSELQPETSAVKKKKKSKHASSVNGIQEDTVGGDIADATNVKSDTGIMPMSSKKKKKKQKVSDNLMEETKDVGGTLCKPAEQAELTIKKGEKQNKEEPLNAENNLSNRKRKYSANSDVNQVQETVNLSENSLETGKGMKKRKLESQLPKKNKKRNPKQNKGGKKHIASDTQTEISDARLKAYGFHPKKFKNKMKYGNKSK